MLRSARTCCRSLHTSSRISERPCIKTILANAGSYIDKDITIKGWVRSLRKSKNISFLVINDGTTHENIQAVLSSDNASNATLAFGSSVAVNGKLIKCHKGSQQFELRANVVTQIGDCASDYPLQKKYASAEHLRENCHLRSRTQFSSSVGRIRLQLARSLAHFFDECDFTERDLSSITTSDCEGAGETFSVKEGEATFRKKTYLAVSRQLHLEAEAMAYGRVWTKDWAYRAERSSTPRHLAEFNMVEAEWCFTENLDELMDVVESLIRSLTKVASTSQNVHFLRTLDAENIEKDVDLQDRWSSILGKPWTRITFRQAIDILQSATPSIAFKFKPKLTSGLQIEHERYLAGHFGGPVFVTRYPAEQKPFYMLPAEDGTVECFDLLVEGMGEICGGSLRDHIFDSLLSRIQSAGMDAAKMKWYTDLRRFGTAPHGGFGIGWERLIAHLCGVNNVREIVAYPRWAGHCEA